MRQTDPYKARGEGFTGPRTPAFRPLGEGFGGGQAPVSQDPFLALNPANQNDTNKLLSILSGISFPTGPKPGSAGPRQPDLGFQFKPDPETVRKEQLQFENRYNAGKSGTTNPLAGLMEQLMGQNYDLSGGKGTSMSLKEASAAASKQFGPMLAAIRKSINEIRNNAAQDRARTSSRGAEVEAQLTDDYLSAGKAAKQLKVESSKSYDRANESQGNNNEAASDAIASLGGGDLTANGSSLGLLAGLMQAQSAADSGYFNSMKSTAGAADNMTISGISSDKARGTTAVRNRTTDLLANIDDDTRAQLASAREREAAIKQQISSAAQQMLSEANDPSAGLDLARFGLDADKFKYGMLMDILKLQQGGAQGAAGGDLNPMDAALQTISQQLGIGTDNGKAGMAAINNLFTQVGNPNANPLSKSNYNANLQQMLSFLGQSNPQAAQDPAVQQALVQAMLSAYS